MEAKIATLSGMVIGFVTNILTGSLGVALLTAFLTGGAAYIGQQVFKYFHNKIKK